MEGDAHSAPLHAHSSCLPFGRSNGRRTGFFAGLNIAHEPQRWVQFCRKKTFLRFAQGVPMSISQEGTVTFTLKHERRDWSTNGAGYNFGSFEAQGMRFDMVKYPDRTLELNLDGPLSSKQTVRILVPPWSILGRSSLTGSNLTSRFWSRTPLSP